MKYSSRELRKRGITKYDAELVLAQGFALPNPKSSPPRGKPTEDNVTKQEELLNKETMQMSLTQRKVLSPPTHVNGVCMKYEVDDDRKEYLLQDGEEGGDAAHITRTRTRSGELSIEVFTPDKEKEEESRQGSLQSQTSPGQSRTRAQPVPDHITVPVKKCCGIRKTELRFLTQNANYYIHYGDARVQKGGRLRSSNQDEKKYHVIRSSELESLARNANYYIHYGNPEKKEKAGTGRETRQSVRLQQSGLDATQSLNSEHSPSCTTDSVNKQGAQLDCVMISDVHECLNNEKVCSKLSKQFSSPCELHQLGTVASKLKQVTSITMDGNEDSDVPPELTLIQTDGYTDRDNLFTRLAKLPSRTSSTDSESPPSLYTPHPETGLDCSKAKLSNGLRVKNGCQVFTPSGDEKKQKALNEHKSGESAQHRSALPKLTIRMRRSSAEKGGESNPNDTFYEVVYSSFPDHENHYNCNNNNRKKHKKKKHKRRRNRAERTDREGSDGVSLDLSHSDCSSEADSPFHMHTKRLRLIVGDDRIDIDLPPITSVSKNVKCKS